MYRKAKKFIALLCTSALAAGAVPGAVIAADSDEPSVRTVYLENFESDSVGSDIANQSGGWATGGDNEKHFNVGLYESMGNSTNIFRQAVTDWWKSDTSNLYLPDSIVHKAVLNGASQSEAEAKANAYLSGNLSISFKANFAVPNPKDFGEDYIRIKDENGNTIVGISAKQHERNETESGDLSTGKLELNSILNDTMDGSAEKTILTDMDISESNTNWYDFKIDIDKENLKLRVKVNDEQGDWMPIGNAEKNGAADSLGMIKEIEFGIWGGAWWQSLYIDDVAIECVSETGVDDPMDDTVLDYVDFSNREQIQQWATANQTNDNGWITAGSHGWNICGNADIQAQASDDNGGCFRIADSNFFQQVWIDHSFTTAVKNKLTYAGATAAEAAVKAAELLSSNNEVSFDVMFNNTSGNDQSVNCAHARVYDTNGNIIGALLNESKKNADNVFEYDKLYYISMNADGNGVEKTFVADVEEGKWYNVKFEFDNDTDKCRLTIDNEVVTTAQGEWTDVASASCGDGGNLPESAEKYDFGAVDKVRFGIWWTNWWQAVYFDNIKITRTDNGSENPTEQPTADPTEQPTADPTEQPTADPTEQPTADPTEQPTADPTEQPTADPTEQPTADPTERPTANPNPEGTNYIEDFESEAAANNVLNQQNGWSSYYAEPEGDHVEHYNVGLYDDTGNTTTLYRQAVTNWWKSSYAWLNLYDNGVYKRTENGVDEETAKAEVGTYLSQNLSVSLKANFAVPNPKDFGEDYIRVKDEEGNTLVGLSMKQDQRIEENGADLSTGKLVVTNTMNDSMTAVEDRTLSGGIDIAEHNHTWYDIRFDFDVEKLLVRVSVNGKAGEWMPISNGDNNGPADHIGMIKEIEFGVYNGAWWQSLYIDDIAVTELAEDVPAPEWGVDSFEMDSNGNFELAVSAGEIRYSDTAVYAALYEGGVLKAVKMYTSPEFDENSLYTVSGSFDVSDVTDDLSVKVFIWHDGMKSVTESYEKNI